MEPVFGVFEIKKQPQDNYSASCNSIDLKKQKKQNTLAPPFGSMFTF